MKTILYHSLLSLNYIEREIIHMSTAQAGGQQPGLMCLPPTFQFFLIFALTRSSTESERVKMVTALASYFTVLS